LRARARSLARERNSDQEGNDGATSRQPYADLVIKCSRSRVSVWRVGHIRAAALKVFLCQMADAIRTLLASGGLHTLFQPILDGATREAIGYEALTRGPAGHE